jgi:hypothetical protein
MVWAVNWSRISDIFRVKWEDGSDLGDGYCSERPRKDV